MEQLRRCFGYILGMRMVYILTGHTSLAMGFIGIFVPLLPTTPFVLLAAACYSRGSQRFHTWIHDHPRFGPMITSWQLHGAIGTRAKLVAAMTILVSMTFSVIQLGGPLRVVAACIGAAVLIFILTRPSAGTEEKGRTL